MDESVEDTKRFYHLLLSTLHQPTPDDVTALEALWKLQRPKFINLLKHAPRSLSDREKVQAASTPEGIRFADAGSPRRGFVILQQQLVDEALILSDVFELNELEALNFVLAGHRETSKQPDWPRGLCAVYLFYKNRWYQAQILKILMRNRQGRYWRHEQPANVTVDGFNQLHGLIHTITDQLWKDNLLDTLLGVIRPPADAVQSEFEHLQQPHVKGLGGPRHRKMVSDCIRETYAAIGDALYYRCCQTPLDPTEFSSLMRFAAENASASCVAPVVFSILQAIDVGILESSDSEEEIANYAPFTTDRSILLAYNKAIVGGQDWADSGPQSVVQLAWATSLRMIARHHLTQATLDEDTLTQDEEDILTNALILPGLDAKKGDDVRGPFHWIRRYILISPEFLGAQLYSRRLHSLLTQLIVCFPLKLKEWRSEADEECRQISETTTTAGMMTEAKPALHFEQLMLLIGEFYGAPANSQLALSEVYFCPSSQDMTTPTRRLPQAQIALFKFLRTSGEMLPSRLYVAYLRMLAGLASNPTSARLCFEMLHTFNVYGASLSAVSIDNFFAALERYLHVIKNIQKSPSNAAPSSPHILPDEMKGLQSWFSLIAAMAEQDDSVRLALFEHPRWSSPANILGLLTCPVPLELKSDALRCLEALALSPVLAMALFEGLLHSGLVPASHTSTGHKLGGINQELEEVESRLETYPFTTGLVKLLATLCQHNTFAPDGTSTAPYVSFVLNSVLVHMTNRNYRRISELWNLAAAVFRFIYNVLDNYDPTIASIVGQSLGCQIMAALMNDGPIFRMLCRICISCVQWMDEYKEVDGSDDASRGVAEAALYSLKVFYILLSKQEAFSASVIESGVPLLTTSLDILLQMLNPQTNEPDYVIHLAMFLTHYYRHPEHCLYAVRIIDALNASLTTQMKLVKYFSSKETTKTRILHGFVTCLSLDDVDAGLEMSDTETETPSESRIRAHTAMAVLELLVSDAKRGGSSASLSSFLAGFDLRRPSDTKLENAGVDGAPRTCLHAVIEMAEAALDQPLAALSFGALVEPVYRLLFWLATSSKTGEPTLRYLRTEYDFFRKHIQRLKLPDQTIQRTIETPAKIVGQKPTHGEVGIAEIAGWLLKMCALELALVSTTQISYATSLSKLLLSVNGGGGDGGYSILDVSATTSARGLARERQTCRSRRIFEFLAAFNRVASRGIEETVVVPRLRHFEGIRLSKVVAACTTKTAKDYYNCDVGRLCDVLERELLALQGTTVVGQLHLMRDEVQNVVETMIGYNEIQYFSYVLRHGFAGFSQTAQLLFSLCPLDWMETEQLDQAIAETMIEALRSNSSVTAEETGGLVLSLTTRLRRRFHIDAPIEERSCVGDTTCTFSFASGHPAGLLDGSMTRIGQRQSLSCAGIIATALKLLIEAILNPENRRANVRTSLYGALMNFFRLWQKPGELDVNEAEQLGSKIFEPTIREHLADDQWAIVGRYVIDLVATLAKDAADGSAVTKTVAMCCLITLLEQDAVHGGAGRKAFVSRGYVNAIRFPPQFQKWITVLTA